MCSQQQNISLSKMQVESGNQPENQQRLLRKPSKIFFRYKQKLIWQVVLILSVCVLAVLQRIFNNWLITHQSQPLADLQKSLALQSTTYVNGQKVRVPSGIISPVVKAYSYTSYFKLQFLVITHLLISLYVGVNAILATTLVYATMLTIYLTSLLQMIYEGPRPYWVSEDVFASVCLPSFNHPSRGTILLFFIVAYAYYLFYERKSSRVSTVFDCREYIMKLAIAFIFLLIELTDYALGLQHLTSIALGIVFFLMFYLMLRFLNVHFDTLIRKSSIMSIDAKKYSFYWLLYISLGELLILIIYSNLDEFNETDWIKNFLACSRYQNIQPGSLKYDQIVGAWNVLLQTATVFGWLGAIFGIAYCFRTVRSLEWYAGPTKTRLIRVAIANLMMIPSWLFIVLVEGQENDQTLARKLGINDFIVDSAHFFLLYLWLFGYMPILVYCRLLKLDNHQRENYYQSKIGRPLQIIITET